MFDFIFPCSEDALKRQLFELHTGDVIMRKDGSFHIFLRIISHVISIYGMDSFRMELPVIRVIDENGTCKHYGWGDYLQWEKTYIMTSEKY